MPLARANASSSICGRSRCSWSFLVGRISWRRWPSSDRHHCLPEKAIPTIAFGYALNLNPTFGHNKNCWGAAVLRADGPRERTTREGFIMKISWLAIAALSAVFGFSPGAAVAEDQIDRLVKSGRISPALTRQKPHSDFSDPLGRFLDYLAAGAIAPARALQPAACDVWRTNRQNTAWTGKVSVWETEIDLDRLCAGGRVIAGSREAARCFHSNQEQRDQEQRHNRPPGRLREADGARPMYRARAAALLEACRHVPYIAPRLATLRQVPSERTMSRGAIKSRLRRQGERMPWASDCKASMRS